VEGKRRVRFSILGIAPRLGLSGGPVRDAVRRLIDKGALRLIERSNIGHLVEVRLPSEVRVPRAKRAGDALASSPASEANLDEVDFLRTGALRQAIHAREGGKCFYCQRQTPSRSHCLDHVVPRMAGGSNSYRNLVSCCMECNSEKRGHTAPDFLRRLFREGQLSREDLTGRLEALRAPAFTPELERAESARMQLALLRNPDRLGENVPAPKVSQRSNHDMFRSFLEWTVSLIMLPGIS
jgi:hypothetical protein